MIPKIGSYNLSPYGFSQWTKVPAKRKPKPIDFDLEPQDRFAEIKRIGRTIHSWFIPSEQKAPLPQVVYLDHSNPRNHLIHLSQMTPDSAVQSMVTQEIAHLLPKQNPIRLGYEDRIQYETALGDSAIVGIAALTSLGILGATFAKTFSCMVHEEDAIEYIYAICKRQTASFWNGSSGKTILTASALFLAASSYVHKKGWLGAWIHDPFLNRRSSQITTLFQTSAKELIKIKTTDPKAAEKIAQKISTHLELIENTLATELQVSTQTAQKAANILRVACKAVLLKKPIPAQESPV